MGKEERRVASATQNGNGSNGHGAEIAKTNGSGAGGTGGRLDQGRTPDGAGGDYRFPASRKGGKIYK